MTKIGLLFVFIGCVGCGESPIPCGDMTCDEKSVFFADCSYNDAAPPPICRPKPASCGNDYQCEVGTLCGDQRSYVGQAMGPRWVICGCAPQ